MDNLQKDLILQMIDEGYISSTKHPDYPLWILNYTQKAQFEKVWNDATLSCRGLIIDADWNIVARPFKKFFNLEEINSGDIPNLPFTVTDKMDGSLGILYWDNNIPYIATRGSFTSEQANHATKILHDKYCRLFSKLSRDITYLFEIVYPENRIVLDYGKEDDIFLIGMIDTKTGLEYSLTSEFNPGFRTTIVYDGVADFRKLRDISLDNREGFVVRFDNGFRVKMKFAEYVRLHRVLTNVTSYTIYEYLRDGKDINELLDSVPDEFYQWVKKVVDGLKDDFLTFEQKCWWDFSSVDVKSLSRKEIAEKFKALPNTGILFSMLDGKSYSSAIWKMIKPAYEKPFANGDEG